MFEIAFEFNLGGYISPHYKNKAYVVFDEKYLLVGFVANADMKNLPSLLCNRNQARVNEFFLRSEYLQLRSEYYQIKSKP